ncbi:hypothetical protein TNCV_3899281 [Trichonephila clavipes]|nr:hypothetical protein TNCV_3899281 [Trichonephila clavipes]
MVKTLLTQFGERFPIYIDLGSFEEDTLASLVVKLVYLSTNFQKDPDSPKLTKMVARVTILVANNIVAKNYVNLALWPRFRQVLFESPI